MCVYYIVRRISGECFATSEEKKMMMTMMVWVVQCGDASTAAFKLFVCQGGCQVRFGDSLIVDLRKRKRIVIVRIDA